jgi:hypothetical protein
MFLAEYLAFLVLNFQLCVRSGIRSQFIANEYHILYRNCNHFSNACSLALLNKPTPSYINRLVVFGQVRALVAMFI